MFSIPYASLSFGGALGIFIATAPYSGVIYRVGAFRIKKLLKTCWTTAYFIAGIPAAIFSRYPDAAIRLLLSGAARQTAT